MKTDERLAHGLILALLVSSLVSACASPVIQERIREVRVPVRVECPAAPERARLRTLRPTRLQDQIMPTTAVERNAKSQAQLGLYEAQGGYADQVDAALNRCQTP